MIRPVDRIIYLLILYSGNIFRPSIVIFTPIMRIQSIKYTVYNCIKAGRDSIVGIATRYGMYGPGIEFLLGGEIFCTVQAGPGVHPASCTVGTGSFLGVKRPGRDVDNSPHLAPLLVFMACCRVTFFIQLCLKILIIWISVLHSNK